MIVPSSMTAMRTQRIELFTILMMSLWNKLKPQPGCEADCC